MSSKRYVAVSVFVEIPVGAGSYFPDTVVSTIRSRLTEAWDANIGVSTGPCRIIRVLPAASLLRKDQPAAVGVHADRAGSPLTPMGTAQETVAELEAVDPQHTAVAGEEPPVEPFWVAWQQRVGDALSELLAETIDVEPSNNADVQRIVGELIGLEQELAR